MDPTSANPRLCDEALRHPRHPSRRRVSPRGSARSRAWSTATALLATGALVSSMVAHAEVFVVHPSGSGDFPTIQAAIDAAQDGDTIELIDGTFTGEGNRDLCFAGKAITIRKRPGNLEPVIIDCQGSASDPHRGFLFISGEGPAAVLEEVTITGGHAMSEDWPAGFGAGIFCQYSSPTIRGCTFTADTSTYAGAISCADSSSPVVSDCLFVSNWTRWFGGAVFCANASSPRFTDCCFRGNESGGVCGGAGGAVTNQVGCSPSFVGCTFSGNWVQYWGGVICSFGGTPSFHACTMYGNDADLSGSAVFCAGGVVTLENCILAFGTGGGSVACEGGSVQLACCDVYGNAGGDWIGCIASQYGADGNISAHPLFCDPDAQDFTLATDSPCAPFSPPNPECDQIGAWPVGCGPQGVAGASGPPGAGPCPVLLSFQPNPLSRNAMLTYVLPPEAGAQRVRLSIHDMAGRFICTLVDELRAPGLHRVVWRGADARSRPVPSGSYYTHLTVGRYSSIHPLVVLR